MVIGSNLLYYESLTSTNTEALMMLRKNEVPEGSVIYSDFQSAGRGQPGNRWESEKGKNLLISIILYPGSVRPEEQFLISMTISLGICDFIDRYIAGSKIKWPNDIYIKDDKIAGILIENTLIGDVIESSVAGIGININQETFPADIRNPVSLKTATGKDHDRDKCLKDLLYDLDKRYRILLYGDRKDIHNEYIRRLYRFNEPGKYRAGKKVFTGRISDVSASGIIGISEENGKISRFSFKEVDFIL
jgi:BirA family transcriptional regulator, biotin operon repressor / biotin---[acetyl-CoA-carboxylase] ligase